MTELEKLRAENETLRVMLMDAVMRETGPKVVLSDDARSEVRQAHACYRKLLGRLYWRVSGGPALQSMADARTLPPDFMSIKKAPPVSPPPDAAKMRNTSRRAGRMFPVRGLLER